MARRTTLATRVAATLLVCAVVHVPEARAYSYETPVTEGCHEAMVLWALREARRSLPSAAPLSSVGDDELLMADLPFSLPADMQDIAAVALVLGARDNDVKGRSGIDTQELAAVHGDPDSQHEHCLRASSQDEPTGSREAWAACRGFVRERILAAIHLGLDEGGWPDTAARSPLDVTLAFRGAVRVELPTFYLRMGQGLHTLADSFSHAFRTADGRRVTTLLNWVDWIDEGYDEARDGPPHMSALDACDNPDELRTARLVLARQATLAALRAALDPTRTAADRVTQIDDVLDAYLGFEPGCTADNRWCDAPENAYRDEPACGCRQAGGPGRPPATWACALGALAGLMLLRRSRGRAVAPRGWRRLTARPASPFVVALVATMTPARAGLAQPSPTPISASAPDGSAVARREPADALGRDPDERSWWDGFGAAAFVSGAIDNGALAFGLGARYAIDRRVLLGLDAEYNPWMSWEAMRAALGAFNGYASIVVRHPVSEGLALRTSGHLGVSVLLFDLVGVPMGSTGPYVGLSLLGLDYELGSGVRLIFDPADVALPVPRITGAPFTYLQYRLTLGLQLGAD